MYTQEDFRLELEEVAPGLPFRTVCSSHTGFHYCWVLDTVVLPNNEAIRFKGYRSLSGPRRWYVAEFDSYKASIVSLQADTLAPLFKDIMVQVFLRNPALTPESLVLEPPYEWVRELAQDAINFLRTTLQARFPYVSPEDKFLADLEATGLRGWKLQSKGDYDHVPFNEVRGNLNAVLYLEAARLLVTKYGDGSHKFLFRPTSTMLRTANWSDLMPTDVNYTEAILDQLRVYFTRRQDLLALPKLPGIFGQWHRNALLKCRENMEVEGNNLQANLSGTKDKLDALWPRLNGLNEHLSLYSNEDERQ